MYQSRQGLTANVEPEDELDILNQLQSYPDNYDLWMKYVRICEKQPDVKKLQKCYDDLLKQYPLLYGYWSKNAKSEYDNINRSKSVFENGLKFLPHCIELWTDFCVYISENSHNVMEVRSLFERATSKVGSAYRSRKLWNKYIEFELSQENYSDVARIYCLMLSYPIKDLPRVWDDYVEFVANRSISELCTQMEFQDLHALSQQRGSGGYGYGSMSQEEQKEVILSWRRQIYERGMKDVEEIQEYEENITRTFFHVEPLDELELHNWRTYLEFAEKKYTANSPGQVVRLYQRSLVPCALYVEFHKRFAFFYQSRMRDVSNARGVLTLAMEVFLPLRPEGYIALADFEESQGDLNKAASIYENLMKFEWGRRDLQSILRHLQFLSRGGDLEKVDQLFPVYQKSIEESGRDYLNVQYAYFLKTKMGNIEKARRVYQEASEQSPRSRHVLYSRIHFELQYPNKDSEDHISDVQKIFEGYIRQESLGMKERYEVLEKYHDFCRSHVKDVKEIRRVEEWVFATKLVTGEDEDLHDDENEKEEEKRRVEEEMKRKKAEDEKNAQLEELLGKRKREDEDRIQSSSEPENKKRKIGGEANVSKEMNPQDLIGKYGYNPQIM